nr:unnamed protein product [Spirometra erinaceieuropaei]
MAEHAAAVRERNVGSQGAAHSTESCHIFKFQEVQILARGDTRVSRELLESWFSGPQSINKRNDLSVPSGETFPEQGNQSRGEGARASNDPSDSESNCRMIITSKSNTDDEIVAINDSDAD